MNNLIKEWQSARDIFMYYALKLAGDNTGYYYNGESHMGRFPTPVTTEDRKYFCEQANNWNKIISELREKIIKSYK